MVTREYVHYEGRGAAEGREGHSFHGEVEELRRAHDALKVYLHNDQILHIRNYCSIGN